jgi:hypothetical protein
MLYRPLTPARQSHRPIECLFRGKSDGGSECRVLTSYGLKGVASALVTTPVANVASMPHVTSMSSVVSAGMGAAAIVSV